MSKNDTKDAPRIDVTLIAPHEHRGELLEAGAKIQVTERQADWLRRQAKIQGETEGESA